MTSVVPAVSTPWSPASWNGSSDWPNRLADEEPGFSPLGVIFGCEFSRDLFYGPGPGHWRHDESVSKLKITDLNRSKEFSGHLTGSLRLFRTNNKLLPQHLSCQGLMCYCCRTVNSIN